MLPMAGNHISKRCLSGKEYRKAYLSKCKMSFLNTNKIQSDFYLKPLLTSNNSIHY